MAAVEREIANPVPWWKEPTKDQWLAWSAAWLGWTLDAFDFTIFLLIMLPISQEFADSGDRGFHPDPVDAAGGRHRLGLARRSDRAQETADDLDRLVFGVQLHCRVFSGFLVSIPVSRLARHRHGCGMALRRGAGDGNLADPLAWVHGRRAASLVGHRRPAVERGFVKEPPVWVENRRLQRVQQREVHVPLLKVFKRGLLYNTLTACWWMASAFVVGYSIGGLFPTYLQKDLQLSPGLVALPVMLQSAVFFLSGSLWGWLADRVGRRMAIIVPALLTIPITPLYLMTGDYTMIVVFFTIQGAFGGGGMHVLYPAYLAERFPTEVRATASGFVYHQGAIFGGLTAPVITYFALNWHLGFAVPMAVGTILGCISVALAVFAGPETRGKQLVAELSVA
jgi:SHS family lactate transporter-like MFS transporter